MRSIATATDPATLKRAWERDATWLNSQYNNRELVPEFQTFLNRWAERSALVREHAVARGAATLDVAYPMGKAKQQSLDWFKTSRPNAPVMVFIHGGYWRALDKSDVSFVTPAYTDAGVHVVVPNYNLCPTVNIEGIALEMAHAVAWVHEHAASFGADGSHVVVAGHSAGGHLAAMMLTCDWRKLKAGLPENLVKSAVSVSGLFDLEPIELTPFLQGDLRLNPSQVKRLSPAGFQPPRGRLRVVVGEQESAEFIRQSQLIEAAWGAAHVPVCVATPGCNHFSVLDEFARTGSSTHRVTLNALSTST
jgi:arylformamidase